MPLKILRLSSDKIRELADRQFRTARYYTEKSLLFLEDGNRLVAMANEKEEEMELRR